MSTLITIYLTVAALMALTIASINREHWSYLTGMKIILVGLFIVFWPITFLMFAGQAAIRKIKSK